MNEEHNLGTPKQPSQPQQPRKRGRPRDPAADGRILNAACALILERGFDSMTVDEVANLAGVGKATVYRRWAKKEDLAVAAMESLYRNETPIPNTGSLRGDLVELFTATIKFASTPAGQQHLRTTIAEVIRDGRIAEIYRQANRRNEEVTHRIFARAADRGEVRDGVDGTLATEFLSGLLTTRVMAGTHLPGVYDVEALVNFVLIGLGKEA